MLKSAVSVTQLEYLIAIDTHRSFVVAADKCFVTQPTLSMQIQKLETELGVTLFDRRKHPVVPTQLGSELIAQARLILQEHSRIKDIIDEKRGVIGGELSLGIIPTLAPYLLPQFLISLLDKYPNLKLSVSELTTTQIVSCLRNEQLDCGILATPLYEPSLSETPLFYEPFVAYLSPSSKLSKKSMLRPEDISLDETWVLNEGHCMRSQVLNFCGASATAAGTSRLSYQTGSIETLRKMVELGKGITLLPELSVAGFNEVQRQHIKRFKAPEPAREVSLVVRRNFLKRQLIEALKRELLAVVPEKMQRKEKKQVLDINLPQT